MSTNNNDILVEVQDLKVYFPVAVGSLIKKKIGDIKAVDGVSFSVKRGKPWGWWEKAAAEDDHGQCPAATGPSHGGKIFFEGQDITGIGQKEIRKLRRRMQIIFRIPSVRWTRG